MSQANQQAGQSDPPPPPPPPGAPRSSVILPAVVPLQVAIQFNPIGLSPLLVQRGGVVRAMVEAWCENAAKCARSVASELGIRMPCGLESSSLPFLVLKENAAALLALGLWCPEDGKPIEPAYVEVQLRELIGKLARTLVNLCSRELDGLVEQYAFVVSDEEPSMGQEKFEDVVERRRSYANSVAKGHRTTAKLLDASVLVADEYPGLIARLTGEILSYCDARKSLCTALDPSRSRGSTIARWSLTSESLINETLKLLRAEVLKDIVAATRSSEFSGWGAERADRVSSIVTQLANQLAELSMYADSSVHDAYSRNAFSKPRVDALSPLLNRPSPTAS